MSFTEAEITEFYTAAKQAYKNALHLQEYSIKDREAKRAKLETLKQEMLYWKKQIDETEAGETPGAIKVKRGLPFDE